MFEVWSGGQTGVDQAALRAAKRAGLATGGWAPKGWETLDGPAPWLAEYGLQECPVAGYPARNEANVRDTDLTIILGNPFSDGSRRALKACDEWGKNAHLFSAIHCDKEVQTPAALLYVNYPAPELIAQATGMGHPDIRRINFAGNRETDPPAIGAAAEKVLYETFRILLSLKRVGS